MPDEVKCNYKDVIRFLKNHPGLHTFGEVAEALGYSRATGGQAVGAMMRAIHNRGFHEYCCRVVNADTRQHGCNAKTRVNEREKQ